MNNVSKGVLTFALKASTNALNTPENLKRWEKRKKDKCDLCGNFGSPMHILNWCKTSLDQGRFTWRHNSFLSHFTKICKGKKPDSIAIYSDLPGHNVNGKKTVPPNILPTAERTDVVIVKQTSKEITILELTCSYETNIESANTYKNTKYSDLKKDIEEASWKTTGPI